MSGGLVLPNGQPALPRAERRRLDKAVADLTSKGIPVPEDTRLLRVKLCLVPFGMLQFFLTQPVGALVECTASEWPDDGKAEVLQARMGQGGVVLVVHHPEFPIITGAQPPLINVQFRRVGADDEGEEASE